MLETKRLETRGGGLVAVERHPVCARIGGAVPVFYDLQMQDAVAARMGKTEISMFGMLAVTCCCCCRCCCRCCVAAVGGSGIVKRWDGDVISDGRYQT
jgi:hypothetical protein